MKRMIAACFALGLCCALSAGAETRTTTYTYTAEGRIATIDGPRPEIIDVTNYTYDSSGNRATMTNALGHVTQYTHYDAAGRLLRVVDPNGLATSFTYHPRGWLLSYTRGEGASSVTTAFDYDAAGNLTLIMLPTGGQLYLTYDQANRLTTIMDSFGNFLVYTLDGMGNRVIEQTHEPTGMVTRTLSRVYNTLNRVQQEVGGATGRQMSYGYDANGNITDSTDGLNRTTTSGYDALDRLVSQLDPANGQTAFGYDARDNLVSVTDQRGNITNYVFNAFDEVTLKNSPDSGGEVYMHDYAGNVVSKATSIDATVYNYDALNRVIGIDYSNLPGQPSIDVTFQYDQGTNGKGHLTQMVDGYGTTEYGYDVRGNLKSETVSAGGLSTSTYYGYDNADNLASITYPSGHIVHYTYDALGRVIGIDLEPPSGGLQSLVSSIAYLPFGPLESMTYGNALQLDRVYDTDYRLVGQSIPGILESDYVIDAVDNITAWTDILDVNRNQTFAYDGLDRLVDADGPYGSLDWTYDALGNRLTETDQSGTTNYVYETNSNRLQNVGGSWIFTRLNGNQSNLSNGDLLEDAAGRLRGAYMWPAPDGPVLFEYNGFNERMSKSDNVNEVHFRYFDTQLLGEYDDTFQPIREYVYLNGEIVAMLDFPTPGGSAVVHYAHTDHLGAVAKLTNQSGQVSWDVDRMPFGEILPVTSSVEMPLRFPGQYYDYQTGLHYNYFRDYDPSTGRYIQSDPIGLAGGLNTYAYVDGNPLRFYDPYGLFGVADLPMFPKSAEAAALGGQEGIDCMLQCLADVAGLSAAAGAGLGASPAAPWPKEWVPASLKGQAQNKSGPTSLARLASVAAGKAVGQKNRVSRALSGAARRVKANPLGAAAKGASRGGALGGLGAVTYCGAKCAASSCK